MLILTSTALALTLMVGCTTFGSITWRNVQIVLRTPDAIPTRVVSPQRIDARLAALWVGHSTVLIQLDDKFVLTDPVFTRFVGGVSPRLVEPGLAIEHLPPLDAVLVSHRHFDHLSKPSLRLIADRTPVVVTPVGAAEDVPKAGYAVEELEPWRAMDLDGLKITAVPVVHAGDRLPGDGDTHRHAYTGYVIEYRGHAVFFAGDSAFDEETFERIAARFPHIDLALMPIGPVAPRADMLPSHMNPEQAIEACGILRARHMMPIHFDTFVHSLDVRGAVAARFEQAARTSVYPPTSLLRIGEQRVYKRRQS